MFSGSVPWLADLNAASASIQCVRAISQMAVEGIDVLLLAHKRASPFFESYPAALFDASSSHRIRCPGTSTYLVASSRYPRAASVLPKWNSAITFLAGHQIVAVHACGLHPFHLAGQVSSQQAALALALVLAKDVGVGNAERHCLGHLAGDV